MTELARRIRLCRENADMSQEELAFWLGYKDRSTVAKVEQGVNNITQSTIEAYADALGTTVQYLMGWTDDPYDYSADPDSRLAEIPLDTFNHLVELSDGDLEEVYRRWCYANAQDAPCRVKEPRGSAVVVDKNTAELREYLEVLRTRPEMRILFNLSKDANKEEVEQAVKIIEALRK